MQDFREIAYQRPDMDAMAEAYRSATEKVKTADSYAAVREAFLSLDAIRRETYTMVTVASVRNSVDTGDAFYEAEMEYLHKRMAELIPVDKAYVEALCDSPFRAEMEKEFGSQLLALLDASRRTGDERLVEDNIRESRLTQEYQRVTAKATTDFRGEKCNFYGLLGHMESPDRAERREAFAAWAGLYEAISPQLDEEYDALIQLRDGMARKLGFADYTHFAYLNRRRFDYTPEDVKVFRDQVKKLITPEVMRIREVQRQKLQLDKVCYYDEALLFPEGNANPIGTEPELVAKAQRMYHEMSPETGEFFDFMVQYHLFDLTSRPGKRMGGYMTRFPAWKAPFIFSNFNGTSADVDVLTHEAGHAFQGYLAMRSIPVGMLQGSTSEINEVHSMSMEHFAYPWMPLFFGDSADKYRAQHLIGALAVIPYMTCVDEFQHAMYENIHLTPKERRQVWRALEKEYMPWRDYDGNAFLEEGGFWMQKQHIFLYPFYYIEYALAQMCAFQYYGRMKEDRKAAWEDYLHLCRCGGTKGYLDLLREGKLLSPFAEGTVEKSVRHVVEEIQAMYR